MPLEPLPERSRRPPRRDREHPQSGAGSRKQHAAPQFDAPVTKLRCMIERSEYDPVIRAALWNRRPGYLEDRRVAPLAVGQSQQLFGMESLGHADRIGIGVANAEIRRAQSRRVEIAKPDGLHRRASVIEEVNAGPGRMA